MRRPGRAVLAGATALTAVAIGILVLWARNRPVPLPAPTRAPAARHAAREEFVGARRCAGCHEQQFAAWERSTHGRAGGDPAQRAIAPFNGVAIRFRDATVIPRVSRGVYQFVVRQPGEEDVVFRVEGVVGGGHIYGGGTQGYVSANADGTLRFLPFEWSRQARTWFCNTNSRSGRGWAPINADMAIAECGDWPPVRVLGDNPRYANCQSCHASQATSVLDTVTRRYETRFTSLDINCESCHGPARRHVELAESGRLSDAADIGLAALGTFAKDASIRVCYQCHAVKDHLRDGFLSGDSLTAYYSLALPLLGDRPLLPDGRIRTFAYQEGHQYSDCYLNGGMTCVSCHDPHDQSYRDVNGAPLSGRFDDRQCTSCHAGIGAEPTAHTRHRTAIACTSCHMPSRQEPETRASSDRFAREAVVPYGRSDHTISIPRPAVDASLGLASACAGCHTNMSVAEQENAVRAKWGALEPLHPAVAAQLRAADRPDSASVLLLGTDDAITATPHAFARFAGVSRFLEERVRADAGIDARTRQRLRELSRDTTDVDTRAVALAILHLADGGSAGTQRWLAATLRSEATPGLRERWATVLGYMGDRFAAAGSSREAMIAYERALDVLPRDARLLATLANTRRDAGDLAGAIAAYQRSVAADRDAPVTWVNFGIALGAAGDTTAAITALTNAATLDPGEALAWYNLANLLFVRGQADSAGVLYARAVRADRSMTEAHFQLARIALMRRDERAALASLRRGLAFDSTDASARETAVALTRRLGNGVVPP